MEASVSANDKKFQEHLLILSKDEEPKVTALLKELRSMGDGRYIEPLVDAFTHTKHDSIKDSIYALLLDLKDESALEPLIACIQNERYKEVRTQLLSVLWQSNLDASSYLVELIEMAVSFDYLDCIEIMTIIDTFEGSYSEEELMNSIYDLDDAIMEEESAKSDLLSEIKSIVNKLMVE